MSISTLHCDEFLAAAKSFVETSDKINDGWNLYQDDEDIHKSYVMKSNFIQHDLGHSSTMLKVEYVIFYNLSYGVPSFSFNIWNSSGMLLSLEEIRKMALLEIDQKEFYSVITQQEHPIFQRPYFIVHPCHTGDLIKTLKKETRNIIVSFLGLIIPIVKIKLPYEYGL